MNVLVIGGTNFIGPHVVSALVGAGHEVTVFNRQRTAVDLPAVVTRLRGDRVEGDLASLQGRSFDATIDMCGFFPRAVHAVFDALADPGHYCFISTISVYASFAVAGQDESAPVATVEDPTSEDVSAHYGALKALCEDVVRERAARSSCLRLGLVVGPGDATDRFTYWLVRALEGGTMIVPRPPGSAMQWIDARDVADFARRCVEDRLVGTYNLVSPAGRHTIGEVVAAAARIGASEVRHLWVDPGVLADHAVAGWSDLPAWMPPGGDYAGFAGFDDSAAAAVGLRSRPLDFTLKDLLDWWSSQPMERRHLRAGLSREREREIVDEVSKTCPIVSFDGARHAGAVDRVVRAAFAQNDEAELVRRLRESAVETIEVVASQGDDVVGHALLSRLDAQPIGASAWALAPVSVVPGAQGRGIGTLLCQVGIEACRARGAELVTVLGSPEYYGRFGFSWKLGERVRSEYSDVRTMWQVAELVPGAADRVDRVTHAPPFSELP